MTNKDQCPVNAMEKVFNHHSKALLHLILISMAIQQIRKKKKGTKVELIQFKNLNIKPIKQLLYISLSDLKEN